MKILFVCTANRLRSRTAYELFKEEWKGLHDVDSGGCIRMYVEDTIKYHWKDSKLLTEDMCENSDIIFVMEDYHKNHILKYIDPKFEYKIKVLYIDDIYDYNDPELISILKEKVKI